MSDDSLIWLGFSSDRWWSPEISAPSVSDSIQGLQIPLTPIIGREREIESVCALLRAVAEASVGLPITLVLDNARYQKCAMVQALAASLKIVACSCC